MTTKVTVTTHDWPVSVTQNSSHDFADENRISYGHSSTTEFLAAHSQKDFAVSNSASLTVVELPKDATGLITAKDGRGAVAVEQLGVAVAAA